MHAVPAHRAEQRPGETAVPPAAHHEQVGTPARHRPAPARGPPFGHLGAHLHSCPRRLRSPPRPVSSALSPRSRRRPRRTAPFRSRRTRPGSARRSPRRCCRRSALPAARPTEARCAPRPNGHARHDPRRLAIRCRHGPLRSRSVLFRPFQHRCRPPVARGIRPAGRGPRTLPGSASGAVESGHDRNREPGHDEDD
jgi:hypothetical protein